MFTTVGFISSPEPVSEGSLSGVPVSLTLDAVSSVAVSVDYQTVDGTAIGGSDTTRDDYKPASGHITIPAGQQFYATTLNLLQGYDDYLTTVPPPNYSSPPPEYFFITLSNPVNATIGLGGERYDLFEDGDPTPTVSFNTQKYVGQEGPGNLTTAVPCLASGAAVTHRGYLPGKAAGVCSPAVPPVSAVAPPVRESFTWSKDSGGRPAWSASSATMAGAGSSPARIISQAKLHRTVRAGRKRRPTRPRYAPPGSWPALLPPLRVPRHTARPALPASARRLSGERATRGPMPVTAWKRRRTLPFPVDTGAQGGRPAAFPTQRSPVTPDLPAPPALRGNLPCFANLSP